MKIAVLSGKGGAGKTFVSVNLANVSGNAVYIDCDVEEPNGKLFFKPQNTVKTDVFTLLPSFDSTKCIGCRKCVDFCRFNALVFIKDKPKVFDDVCHSCGGCGMVCPAGAISEKEKTVGTVECGTCGGIQVVTGCLNLGEASGIPVINAALSKAGSKDALTVIDCPPGSACSVMESVRDADYCVLVAEPTSFGLHNFRMVYELVSLMNRKCGAVINKSSENFEELDDFCAENDLRILCRIPYSETLARLCAEGKLASACDEQTAQLFSKLLSDIREEAAK